jgi:hypothetical protein
MFFSVKGLQQCTDYEIANYKANRFSDCDTIADYCCGIGGDLIALGNVGRTNGFDLDPMNVAMANANCESSKSNASAELADVTQLDPASVSAWHIDPDRRASGSRTTRWDNFQPSRESILRLTRRNPNCAIKLAPATPVDEDWLQAAELEWIGHSRSCQQLVAWHGDLARQSGKRIATILRDGESFSFSGIEEAPSLANEVDEFVYEPHAAVLAAGLSGSLANSLNLTAIIPGGGYLTGDAPIDNNLISSFRVLDVVPFREKRIKQLLGRFNAGVIEVKKRGVDIDPAKLQKLWRSKGDRTLSVIVTRRDRSVIAIVAERLNSG